MTSGSTDADPGAGVRVRAFAKINLGLRVVGRRPDGYHEVRTVLASVALHDTLWFRPSGASGEVRLETDDPALPTGDGNLIRRAAAALAAEVGRRPPGVAIRLEKRIPVGAGLGGGSSDAAATLVALNRLWRLRLPTSALERLGGSFGMDVPFFLHGGLALALGRGEIVHPLAACPDLAGRPVAILVPRWRVPTAEAYRRLTPRDGGGGEAPDFAESARILARLGGDAGPTEIRNDLAGSGVFDGGRRSDLERMKAALLGAGATAVGLSGSGSAVFGVFSDRRFPDAAVPALAADKIRLLATRTISRPEHRRGLGFDGAR